MRIICDTPTLPFWAHAPTRLSPRASAALEQGQAEGVLAIADMSLWELAPLEERGRLQLPADAPLVIYVRRLLEALRQEVLPITAEIAQISRGSFLEHGDPADRLIAASALAGHCPLITADETLRLVPQLNVVW